LFLSYEAQVVLVQRHTFILVGPQLRHLTPNEVLKLLTVTLSAAHRREVWVLGQKLSLQSFVLAFEPFLLETSIVRNKLFEGVRRVDIVIGWRRDQPF
jgi:hypothetical protein